MDHLKNIKSYIQFGLCHDILDCKEVVLTYCSMSDEDLTNAMLAVAEQKFESDKDRYHAATMYMINKQGGINLFIDDERNPYAMIKDKCIALIAVSRRQADSALELKPGIKLRHVFFDFWLGLEDNNNTISAAVSIEALELKGDKFTFSCHSADKSAIDKLATILGKENVAEWKYPTN